MFLKNIYNNKEIGKNKLKWKEIQKPKKKAKVKKYRNKNQ
jgi:hypothetical protein